MKSYSRSGFSLPELLMVLLLMMILMSLFMVSISQLRQHTRRLTCLSNLRSLHQVTSLYADMNSAFPMAGQLPTVDDLLVFDVPNSVWLCPASPPSRLFVSDYQYPPGSVMGALAAPGPTEFRHARGAYSKYLQRTRAIIFQDDASWHPGRYRERINVVEWGTAAPRKGRIEDLTDPG